MVLKLLSVNVQGLRARAKRLTLFHALLQGHWDIVFLQETHHIHPTEAADWLQQGAGPGRPLQWHAFWSHGTASRKGTGILINPGSEFQPAADTAVTDSSGRVVRVDGTLHDEPLSLICVYAPCEKENRVNFFLNTLLPLLPTDRAMCLGGDLNCIAEPHDQQGSTTQHRLTGFHGGLELVEQRLDLVDAWRYQHPTDSHGFTHVADGSSSRLDRWLVSRSLLHRLHNTAIETTAGLPGDHVPVSLALRPATQVPRGPGVWCFPAHLLDQPALRELILHTIREHTTGFTSNSSTPAAELWETLKRKIRDVAQMYSFKAAARTRSHQKLWRKKMSAAAAALASDPTDPTAVQQWKEAQKELKGGMVRQAQLAALRAGVLWEDFGEQSTFWFHRMGRLRQTQTSITSLLIDPADPASEFPLNCAIARAKAEEVIAAFYSGDSALGLFRVYPTDEDAQRALLDSLDKTLDTQSAGGSQHPDNNGVFTADELEKALSSTANNKRPGPDGLPYEFYKCFWLELHPHLVAVCAETFSNPEGRLPDSLTTGVVTLLYKEKGSRADLKNYRPITLLNTDYKIIAKAFANRIAEPLSTILEPTQTAFMPHRWIGDNILDHLEEVDYLVDSQQPGCILFLDFEKAFDRTSRDWILRCMQRLGFDDSAQRWVSILHSNTFVHVLYNGWRTDKLPLHSGVFQGSPLSPLLFNIAVQPLASFLRRMQDRRLFRGITLPGGSTAPVVHQHADDTTIHTRSLADARIVLDEGVELYCRATGAKLNREKSMGFAFNQPHTPGARDPITGVQLVSHEDHIRHLGILISPTNPAVACTTMYTRIKRGIAARIAHWSAQHLSPVGRMHVAKQVFASMLYHHATFIPPDPATLQSITSLIDNFVTPHGRYHPRKAITCLPDVDGGMKAVHLPIMLQALHAKIWARLSLPGPSLWKTLLLHKLASSTHGIWNLGAFAALSTIAPGSFNLPHRITAYMRAFRALHFHRTEPSTPTAPEQVLAEKLFHNRRITTASGRPLGGARWEALARAGVTTVLQLAQARSDSIAIPQHLRPLCVDICLPPEWQDTINGDTGSLAMLPWRLVTASVIGHYSQNPPTTFKIGVSGTLEPCTCPAPPPQLAIALPVAMVMQSVDTSSNSGPPDSNLAYIGLLSTTHLHPRAWSFGQYTIDEFAVHRAATRLLRLEALRVARSRFQPGHGVQPRAWQGPTGELGDQLTDLERQWAELYAARTAPASAGRRRSRSPPPALDDVYHVGWMDDPRPRPHWRARQQARQAAAGDTDANVGSPAPAAQDDSRDLLAPPPGPVPGWTAVWKRLKTLDLPRPVFFSNWSALHAALPFGAPRLRTSSPDATVRLFECPFACCTAQLQTLSHVFVTCPVAEKTLSWLWRLWQAITGAAPPQPTTQIVLVGDPEAFAPRDGEDWLWHRLRCHVVHALKEEAADQHAQGDRATRSAGTAESAVLNHMSANPSADNAAHAVIGRFIAAVRRDVEHDWLRCQEDPRFGLDGTYSSWFRGRDPCITPEEFRSRWCKGGICCSASGGSLRLKLSFSSAAVQS